MNAHSNYNFSLVVYGLIDEVEEKNENKAVI
jgi:hypothetical protein